MGCCESGTNNGNKEQELSNFHLNSSKNKVVNCCDEREITIDNRSNIQLWVIVAWQRTRSTSNKSSKSSIHSRQYSGSLGAKALGYGGDATFAVSSSTQCDQSNDNLIEFDTEHKISPSENKVPIWSKESYNGYKHTFIIAWYYKECESDEKHSLEDEKVMVCDNKCISLNQDIFIFDGKYLRVSDFNSPYKNVVNMRKISYIEQLYANGATYYIMPAIFKKDKTLCADSKDKIVTIKNLTHINSQKFVIQNKGEGYCKLYSAIYQKFWMMHSSGYLCIGQRSRHAAKTQAHFKIEPIPGSDITVKIKYRGNGKYLKVNDQSRIITDHWDQDDPSQRFFLEKIN